MKAFRFLTVAVFGALLATAISVCAQEPQQQQQEERRDQAKPKEQEEPKREEARPARPQDEKPPKQEQREEQAKPSHDQQPGHAGQQAQHARPAGKSARIPGDKFRASFGRQHTFVINRPVIVQGQPQFVYAGYTFVFLDPWPAVWLYTDDCYIDYIDGDYFLFDVLHPGIRVALFVEM